MKGLEEYIKVNGRHFTVELAEYVCKNTKCFKWNIEQIYTAIDKEVWYNTTESTLGDIVFLVNTNSHFYDSKKECISKTLSYIGDINNTEKPFTLFVCGLYHNKIDFDFNKYIKGEP